jgi:hypothetical protein
MEKKGKFAIAILKSLEDFDVPVNYKDSYENAKAKGYLNLLDCGDTPIASWSAQLGNFIRGNDNRVKRVKKDDVYCYYLASKEEQIKFQNEEQINSEIDSVKKNKKTRDTKSFTESSLHKLFVSFLRSRKIYSKTIPHKSSTMTEKNQIWTHPDIVGVKFLDLEPSTNNFLKTINVIDMFDIYSYELKKEIKNDTELKEKYFQSVSNSSWANYGYLVAFDIDDYLKDELKRLNQSFGIGVIQLKNNPFESEIICEAKYNNLDFNTISKLCKQNPVFKEFIETMTEIVKENNENSKSFKSLWNDFIIRFCDEYFKGDENDEIEKYCNENHIPIEGDEEMEED